MINIPINPIAFQIGSLQVRWYGIMIALGVFWLVYYAYRQVRRGMVKITPDNVFTLAIVGIPSGIVISRLLHVLDNIVVARTHPELVLSGQVIDYTQNWASIIGGEGLTAWGAVLGASLGIWIYARITKMKVAPIFDMLAPGVIMTQAIGRVGCLINGCCPGVPSNSPWSITYTNSNSIAFGIGSTQPTVFFEMLYNIAGFFVLQKLRGKFRPAGSLYVLYLVLYSAWRLVADSLRPGNPFFFGLHQAQVISIGILVVSLPWMALKMRLAKPAPAEMAEAPPTATA